MFSAIPVHAPQSRNLTVQRNTSAQQAQRLQPHHHPSEDSVSFSGKSRAEASKKRPLNPEHDDWTEVTDPREKRKIQNRNAQRDYRKRLKQRLQQADSLVKAQASSSAQAESSVRPAPDEDLDGEYELDDDYQYMGDDQQRMPQRRSPHSAAWMANGAQDADYANATEAHQQPVKLGTPPPMNPFSGSFMAGFGVWPQESASQTRSHNAMLMHFARHNELDANASATDHIALLHAMLQLNAKPELISDYLAAVERRYGLSIPS